MIVYRHNIRWKLTSSGKKLKMLYPNEHVSSFLQSSCVPSSESVPARSSVHVLGEKFKLSGQIYVSILLNVLNNNNNNDNLKIHV